MQLYIQWGSATTSQRNASACRVSRKPATSARFQLDANWRSHASVPHARERYSKLKKGSWDTVNAKRLHGIKKGSCFKNFWVVCERNEDWACRKDRRQDECFKSFGQRPHLLLLYLLCNFHFLNSLCF